MRVKRVVLITGASGAIGFATAKILRDAGHVVVMTDRDAKGGETRAAEIGADFHRAELCDRKECAQLVDTVSALHGRIDILVNNACIQHMAPIETFPMEKWDEILAVSLTAPFILTQHAFPGMKENGWGRIINIASIQGLIASPFKVAYVTAKTGLLGLTRATAIEGGEYGITANALCPAFVDSPLLDNQLSDLARYNDISPDDVKNEVFFKSTCIKRLISPEEVGSLIGYLCSDSASAVTGATWTIDLGYTVQ